MPKVKRASHYLLVDGAIHHALRQHIPEDTAWAQIFNNRYAQAEEYGAPTIGSTDACWINVIFGHVHIAKTAGTELNGLLASRYEHVCLNKGYSFDYYQHNKRVRSQGKAWNASNIQGDSVSKLVRQHNRGRVPVDEIIEQGFEDCDFISHETSPDFWKQLGTNETSMELHVPCRDPIDHLLSACNYMGEQFDCQATNFAAQLKRYNYYVVPRFDDSLLSLPDLPVKCFPTFPVS